MTAFDSIGRDVEKVKKIPIIETILDVVIQTTGMGFAAVARVTEDRWIACCVNDPIGFGLKSGGELKIESTLCNEIRDHHEPIIIDNVAEDARYCQHHTPKTYGLQSYISYPIILKNGEFFGTLCAIDPAPNLLKNPKVMGMFTLFADLIGFHLQSIDMIEKSSEALIEIKRQLINTEDENRQYHHISNHNLQEPLRKIRMFSSMLINSTDNKDLKTTTDLAFKVNTYAQRVSMMINDLSGFAELNQNTASYEKVDLNKVLTDVSMQLAPELESKGGTLAVGQLPVIEAITYQLEQLFYHLISNAIKFSRPGIAPIVEVQSRQIDTANYLDLGSNEGGYVEISVKDNGEGIEKSELEKIFDIFSQVKFNPEGAGVGLAYCRKIIRNHGGIIEASSTVGVGTTISVILPMGRKFVRVEN